jgi:muramoyltetrapeptide carboxypeptidase
MIRPPHLKKGDTVAITAPASIVKTEAIEIGIAVLKKWGLKVVIGETVGNAYHNFSGTDEMRKSELQNFLDNPELKCIIAARGGYGVSRILDDLDFTLFSQHPKWVVGFSDLTALIAQINTLGIAAIHGPMVKTFSFDKSSNEYLKKILFGEITKPYILKPNTYNKIGTANGQATGGNLCLINHIIGTQSDIDFSGKILFIEDISEYYYAIDRYLVQLKRAGKLDKLAGLVVGDFSDFKNQDIPFGKSIEEIVLDHCSAYEFPIAFGFQFGHEKINHPIVMGGEIELDIRKDKATLKF